jgi:penicillin-binding protein 2
VAAGLSGHSGDYFTCNGGVQYGGKFKKCWIFSHGGAHGTLGLEEALQRSCNAYFYLLGNTMGPKPMVKAAELLGFGRPTGLELQNEKGGIVMGSRYWREVLRRRPNRSMTPAEVANMVIGQGETKATPVQIAVMVAAIANGGKVLQPRLVRKVVDADGKQLWPDGSDGRRRPADPIVVADLLREGVPAETLETIRAGMYAVVNKPGGTARGAAIKGAGLCGKTGSAQTTIRGKKGTHAWFTGFTSRENPRYAICVTVLGGKSGGKVAAPLAKTILQGIFAIERERILPGSGARPHLARLQPAPGNFDPTESITINEEGGLAVLTDQEETPDIRPARVVYLPIVSIQENPDEEGMVVRRARPVEDIPPPPE